MKEQKHLTDEELVRTLESCAKPGGCQECPLGEVDCSIEECRGLMLISALDLIRHFKTENAVLREERKDERFADQYQIGYADGYYQANMENHNETLRPLKYNVRNQIVKEVAKEIYQELCEHGTTYVKKWIKERYGVEVEM